MNIIKNFINSTKDSAILMFKGCETLNLYKADGRVPVKKALPYMIQHIIPVLIFNIAPILLVFAAIGLTGTPYMTQALLASFFISGVATIIQLIAGVKLPIIFGTSFTYAAVLISIGQSYGINNQELIASGMSYLDRAVEGYKVVMGALVIGGAISFFLSFFAKWITKIIKPIVAPIVLIGVGLTLIQSAMNQFLGLDYYVNGVRDHINFYIIIGFSSLISALLWQILIKGPLKNMYAIVGILVGYIVSLCIPGIVNFDSMAIHSISDVISYPKFIKLTEIKIHAVPVIMVVLFYLVSFVEVVGNTSASAQGAYNRAATEKEINSCYIANCFNGALGSLFGALPLVTFTANISMVSQSKVVNRYHLFLVAIVLIIFSFFPPIANLFATIPDPVMGGVLVLLFGSIFIVGVQMLSQVGFSPKNTLIATLSVSIGFGITLCSPLFDYLNSLGLDIISQLLSSAVLNMFILAIILSFIIPESYNNQTGIKEKSDSE